MDIRKPPIIIPTGVSSYSDGIWASNLPVKCMTSLYIMQLLSETMHNLSYFFVQVLLKLIEEVQTMHISGRNMEFSVSIPTNFGSGLARKSSDTLPLSSQFGI